MGSSSLFMVLCSKALCRRYGTPDLGRHNYANRAACEFSCGVDTHSGQSRNARAGTIRRRSGKQPHGGHDACSDSHRHLTRPPVQAFSTVWPLLGGRLAALRLAAQAWYAHCRPLCDGSDRVQCGCFSDGYYRASIARCPCHSQSGRRAGLHDTAWDQSGRNDPSRPWVWPE